MSSKVPKITLANGNEIPILGLGTFLSKADDVIQAVGEAIELGYRHIDCALVYENEQLIGQAVRDKISQGVVKREDLFITSKLWNSYHKFDSVEVAIRKSLSNFGLDYLDLYLIHWPVAHKDGDELFPKTSDGKIQLDDVDYLDTWRGMEAVLSKKLTKNIGISNFNSEQITRLLANCNVKPVVNQIECHPYLNQRKLSDFCKERGIVITAYSPLGAPERPWAQPSEPVLLDDDKLNKIAEKYNKSTAQVLIRYQVDRGHVVIPKTVTKSRIMENFQVFDFKLNDQDVVDIDTMDVNGRFCILAECKESPNYPFHIPF